MKAFGLFIFISILAFTFTGCATYPLDGSSRAETNLIKKVSSRKGEVRTVYVTKQSGKTLVSGSIRRKTASRILKGHVHIELQNKEETVLDRKTVDYRLKRNGRRVAKSAKFKAVLDTPLTKDITIKVEHHDTHDAEEGTGTLNIM